MHSFVDNIINCKHWGAYMIISCIQIITDYMRVHSSWCCQHNWIVRCALNNKKTTSVSSCYYSLYSRIEFGNSSYRICTRFLALWSVICSSTIFFTKVIMLTAVSVDRMQKCMYVWVCCRWWCAEFTESDEAVASWRCSSANISWPAHWPVISVATYLCDSSSVRLSVSVCLSVCLSVCCLPTGRQPPPPLPPL